MGDSERPEVLAYATPSAVPSATVRGKLTRGGKLAILNCVLWVGVVTTFALRPPKTIRSLALAVGVVIRLFDNVESQKDAPASPGMAIALTSTSEAWDRFWDDVSATDDEGDS